MCINSGFMLCKLNLSQCISSYDCFESSVLFFKADIIVLLLAYFLELTSGYVRSLRKFIEGADWSYSGKCIICYFMIFITVNLVVPPFDRYNILNQLYKIYLNIDEIFKSMKKSSSVQKRIYVFNYCE